ncbi:hypothetical protein ZIOFF_030259 [Zingiber officinale]|uniref:Uncharacterized protein n=1 Tax=Zingiber officinale TaxID=94328 RepID=A0A8J5H3E0_ZINOF|nr:hypothetical protein ZIOFF_030259 [Zingiber officinale]
MISYQGANAMGVIDTLGLRRNLNPKRQRASDLTKITVSEKQLRESRKTTSEEPKAKRLCGSDKLLNKREAISCNKSSDEISYANNNKVGDSSGFLDEKDDKISSNAIQTAALDKSKTLATSMVTKTSYLLGELKNMKLELWLMQERCNMLEEENIRLRESFDNGARLEDDDLQKVITLARGALQDCPMRFGKEVNHGGLHPAHWLLLTIRLQLETLLAEKSRLANDNANLLRENQCLHQLIEYHKLISQDLSTSDEELDTHGMCLDFSSPQARSESGLEDEAHSDCKPGCDVQWIPWFANRDLEVLNCFWMIQKLLILQIELKLEFRDFAVLDIVKAELFSVKLRTWSSTLLLQVHGVELLLLQAVCAKFLLQAADQQEFKRIRFTITMPFIEISDYRMNETFPDFDSSWIKLEFL